MMKSKNTLNPLRIIICILLLLTFRLKSLSQDLIVYSDTLNKFSIGLPNLWQYQTSKIAGAGLKFIATRPKANDSEKFVENFNVNIVSFRNANLELAYADMKNNIRKRKGYTAVEEGDTSFSGIKYKWHLEIHINAQTSEPMIALILLGYKNEQGYMVTLATTVDHAKKYESLYRKIAFSFRLQ